MTHKGKAIFLFIMLFVLIYMNLTSEHWLAQVCSVVGAWFAGFGCYYNGGVHLGIAEK
tara:strand:- start:75 stop:248 length:174 start_codon:yes stop_codon:yes gene_type:complete